MHQCACHTHKTRGSNKPVHTHWGTPGTDWTYYTMKTGRLEVVEGAYAGTVMPLKPWDGKPHLQVGSGLVFL